MTVKSESEWLSITPFARRFDMDARTAKKFLERAGIRSRQLPGTKKMWSVDHALEVIASAEGTARVNQAG